jgi:uncharacterized protein (DUF1697 family)
VKTWIALLRGINVGGRTLPMQELRELLAELGCRDVKTYIQSGNVVFRSSSSSAAALEVRISRAVAARRGFAPRVLVLTRRELRAAAEGNPFAREAAATPTSVHVFFLAETPQQPDLAGLERVRAPSEAFALRDRTLYLHTPDGLGTSKLAERAERLLGVEATARNWRTVCALLD